MEVVSKEQLQKILGFLTESTKEQDVEWLATTVKFKNGARITIHTANAPKRPAGITSDD